MTRGQDGSCAQVSSFLERSLAATPEPYRPVVTAEHLTVLKPTACNLQIIGNYFRIFLASLSDF